MVFDCVITAFLLFVTGAMLIGITGAEVCRIDKLLGKTVIAPLEKMDYCFLVDFFIGGKIKASSDGSCSSFDFDFSSF